jgi:predicted Zn-dependent protease
VKDMQPNAPGAADAPEDSEKAAVESAQQLLNRGEPLLAYNAVQEGRRRWPDSLRLRQLEALALARSGDVERAHAILEGLVAQGGEDAETLGMLARTHKDLALRSADATRRAAHLQARLRGRARPPGGRGRDLHRHQRGDHGRAARRDRAGAAHRRRGARDLPA